MAFQNKRFMLVKHIFIQFRNIRLKIINPKWITNMQRNIFLHFAPHFLCRFEAHLPTYISCHCNVFSCTIARATSTKRTASALASCVRVHCVHTTPHACSYVQYWNVDAEREHYRIPSNIPQIDKYSSHIYMYNVYARINSHATFPMLARFCALLCRAVHCTT